MLAYVWMGATGVSVLSISFYVLHTLPPKPFLCRLDLPVGVCLDF